MAGIDVITLALAKKFTASETAKLSTGIEKAEYDAATNKIKVTYKSGDVVEYDLPVVTLPSYEQLSDKPKINDIELNGNLTPGQLGLQISEDELKKAFVAKYGNITLIDNPYSDWQQYVNDMAIELMSGLKHLYAPYSHTMLVEVFIDRDGEYPITFNWSGKLYGKNATGIKEIGISPDSVVMRDDLADDVLQILDAGIINAGEIE